jgi:tRNA threonylcarbamoyl adenosine modification protein YeaZ
MILYLALASTYESIDVALFNDHVMLGSASISKIEASKAIVTTIQLLMAQHNRSLDDLSFIIVNQGPGPFTTLRVAITTANGISFATGIPLIGINALQALLFEYDTIKHLRVLALMNAFTGDLYFAVAHQGEVVEQGCQSALPLLHRLREQWADEPLGMVGNGVDLYRREIIALFGDDAYLQSPSPATASIALYGSMGLRAWRQQKMSTTMLLPLYLKQFKIGP